jgi:hypothetical protein
MFKGIVRVNAQKVFGIGHYKAGTLSLHKACNILGFKSCHFWVTGPAVKRWLKGEESPILTSIIDEYDIFWDQLGKHWRELIEAYPDAKFVLTQRQDFDAWITSCLIHVLHNRLDPDYSSGWTKIDKSVLEEVYNEALKAKQYFEDTGKLGQLLVIDICSGEGWEKLCPFLGVDIPDQPFPRVNTSLDKLMRILHWTEDVNSGGHDED